MMNGDRRWVNRKELERIRKESALNWGGKVLGII
jgi:hypothetical protein